jgi:DNA-binding NarL/FixJ family response regulator
MSVHDVLTARQRDVTRCIRGGITSNRAIAEQLHIKPRTVKAYLREIYWKFGIVDGSKRVKLAVALLGCPEN